MIKLLLGFKLLDKGRNSCDIIKLIARILLRNDEHEQGVEWEEKRVEGAEEG
jgi:hypothetical protein